MSTTFPAVSESSRFSTPWSMSSASVRAFERERASRAPLSPSGFTTGRQAMSTIHATMKRVTRPNTTKRPYQYLPCGDCISYVYILHIYFFHRTMTITSMSTMNIIGVSSGGILNGDATPRKIPLPGPSLGHVYHVS